MIISPEGTLLRQYFSPDDRSVGQLPSDSHISSLIESQLNLEGKSGPEIDTLLFGGENQMERKKYQGLYLMHTLGPEVVRAISTSGFPVGTPIVDLQCRFGFMTDYLSRQYSTSPTFGVDSDPNILAAARVENVRTRGKNPNPPVYLQTDVKKGFPKEIDGVPVGPIGMFHESLLFPYLTEQEILDLLKINYDRLIPGGGHVAIETDLDDVLKWRPNNEAHQILNTNLIGVLEDNGQSPHIASKLPQLFRQARYRNVTSQRKTLQLGGSELGNTLFNILAESNSQGFTDPQLEKAICRRANLSKEALDNLREQQRVAFREPQNAIPYITFNIVSGWR